MEVLLKRKCKQRDIFKKVNQPMFTIKSVQCYSRGVNGNMCVPSANEKNNYMGVYPISCSLKYTISQF